MEVKQHTLKQPMDKIRNNKGNQKTLQSKLKMQTQPMKIYEIREGRAKSEILTYEQVY